MPKSITASVIFAQRIIIEKMQEHHLPPALTQHSKGYVEIESIFLYINNCITRHGAAETIKRQLDKRCEAASAFLLQGKGYND